MPGSSAALSSSAAPPISAPTMDSDITPDPFGNSFGPMEGLGYVSSDLTSLGYFLLRTPVSVVLLVGACLLFAKRLSNGAKLVTAWALSLVVVLAA